MRDPLRMIADAYEDSRLSALDKSIYVFVCLHTDQTGEYRFGKSYLTKHLPAGEHTVTRSFRRLAEYGYLLEQPIGVSRWSTWRVMAAFAPEEMALPVFDPTDHPRMTMPSDRAAAVIRYLLEARQRVQFGLMTEMQVPEDQRLTWLAEGDFLDDLIDEFSRWLGRFGGGIPQALQSRLDPSSTAR